MLELFADTIVFACMSCWAFPGERHVRSRNDPRERPDWHVLNMGPLNPFESNTASGSHSCHFRLTKVQGKQTPAFHKHSRENVPKLAIDQRLMINGTDSVTPGYISVHCCSCGV